jgi:hypothetical protein
MFWLKLKSYISILMLIWFLYCDLFVAKFIFIIDIHYTNI